MMMLLSFVFFMTLLDSGHGKLISLVMPPVRRVKGANVSVPRRNGTEKNSKWKMKEIHLCN